ncbi:hypothetical protein B4O85_08455 [Pseudomonas azotoformans]|uniref:Uncharacterized protein n=1 Tax=Pseudomonas azotoformans TaxID=47878 RepID=A0A4Q0HWJ5_PSEAZ|nr:hypothetical protein B4O85_08455 [Pseudomonas azotoformans]
MILILSAPSNHAGRNSTGIWGVNRQGCRFSRPAEVPSGGARAFCLLWPGPASRLLQSEPPSGRNPKCSGSRLKTRGLAFSGISGSH